MAWLRPPTPPTEERMVPDPQDLYKLVDDIPDVQTVHTLLYRQAFDGSADRGGYGTGEYRDDRGGDERGRDDRGRDDQGGGTGRKAW